LAIISEYEELERSFTHIRGSNDPKESLRVIGSMNEVHYPKYWSCPRDANTMGKAKRVELNKSSQCYQEVEKIIVGTWESSKVGHGNDAVGLTHKNVAVRKVWRVEHPSLYRSYDTKRKALCLQASDDLKTFPPINGLQGEGEVVTRTLGACRVACFLPFHRCLIQRLVVFPVMLHPRPSVLSSIQHCLTVSITV